MFIIYIYIPYVYIYIDKPGKIGKYLRLNKQWRLTDGNGDSTKHEEWEYNK